MSGGTWNYHDEILDYYRLNKLIDIMEALRLVFHKIDWAESGDTTRKDVEPEIYDIFLDLGNKLFGDF